MRRFSLWISVLTLLAAFGCSRAKEEAKSDPQTPATPSTAAAVPPATQAATPEAPAPTAPSAAAPAKSATKPGRSTRPASTPATAADAPPPPRQDSPAPAPPPPPPAPRFETVVVRAGTPVQIRLSQRLTTETNRTGDRFEAILERDLTADGRVVAERGSTVTGRLVEVDPSGRIKGRARMSLALVEIKTSRETFPLQTPPVSLEADSSKGRDTAKIGGGAGLGAIIGAIAGGGKGAAIGAAIGGVAGGATVLATRGKHVELEPEQRIQFELQNEIRTRVEIEPAAGSSSASARTGDTAAFEQRIGGKVSRLQSLLPAWIKGGGDASRVQSLMTEFDRLMRAGRPADAEAKVDEALAIIDK